MHALKLIFVSSLIAVLLSGCGGGSSSAPSAAYTTNNIYAFMEAIQHENGDVNTTVQLRDSTATNARYLYLNGGDALYSSLDVPPQQYLSITGDLFNGGRVISNNLKVMFSRYLYYDYFLFFNVVAGEPEYYSVDTPATGSSQTRAYVAFERNGQAQTGESSVVMPNAFQITAPVAEVSVSRTNPLVLSWSNVESATSMLLKVGGMCDDNTRYHMEYMIGPDVTGTVSLNSADYFPATGTSTSATCRVAFMLQRVRTAGVASSFAAGSFKGIQQRTVQFTITP
jgi:hypothetical protein